MTDEFNPERRTRQTQTLMKIKAMVTALADEETDRHPRPQRTSRPAPDEIDLIMKRIAAATRAKHPKTQTAGTDQAMAQLASQVKRASLEPVGKPIVLVRRKVKGVNRAAP